VSRVLGIMAIIYGQDTLSFSDVVSALSVALDLTEGQPMGHCHPQLHSRHAHRARTQTIHRKAVPTCIMPFFSKIPAAAPTAPRLHQIMGCDDIQAKREVKLENWTEVSISGLKYLLRNVLLKPLGPGGLPP
jgi:hypothetical protein